MAAVVVASNILVQFLFGQFFQFGIVTYREFSCLRDLFDDSLVLTKLFNQRLEFG